MGDVVDSGYLAPNPLYGIGVSGPVAPEREPPPEGEGNAGARKVENGGANGAEGGGAEAGTSGTRAVAAAGVEEGLGAHVDVRV